MGPFFWAIFNGPAVVKLVHFPPMVHQVANLEIAIKTAASVAIWMFDLVSMQKLHGWAMLEQQRFSPFKLCEHLVANQMVAKFKGADVCTMHPSK